MRKALSAVLTLSVMELSFVLLNNKVSSSLGPAQPGLCLMQHCTLQQLSLCNFTCNKQRSRHKGWFSFSYLFILFFPFRTGPERCCTGTCVIRHLQVGLELAAQHWARFMTIRDSHLPVPNQYCHGNYSKVFRFQNVGTPRRDSLPRMPLSSQQGLGAA
jgi:hypothetical protein